jgi:hypothetical protein
MVVQKKLSGYDEELVEQDRSLVKEAYLLIFGTKKGKEAHPKKFHNFMCFLFNGIFGI